MTFTDSVRTCLREKYVTFSGRASRSEYWWFQLFYVLVMIGFALIFYASGLFNSLALILPLISVVVRRFHDRNLSGWWYLGGIIAGMIPFLGILASIAILVLTILKGTLPKQGAVFRACFL